MLKVLEKVYTRRLRFILQHRYFIKVVTILFLIFIILFTKIYQKRSIYNGNETEVQGIVYKKKISEDKITLYVKGKEKVVINYYIKGNLNISLGDEIKVVGKLKVPSNNTIPNLFNYKNY